MADTTRQKTTWVAWSPKGSDPRIAAARLPANREVTQSFYLLMMANRIAAMAREMDEDEARSALLAALGDQAEPLLSLPRDKWVDSLMDLDDLHGAVTSNLSPAQTWPVKVSQSDPKAEQAIEEIGLLIWLDLVQLREAA